MQFELNPFLSILSFPPNPSYPLSLPFDQPPPSAPYTVTTYHRSLATHFHGLATVPSVSVPVRWLSSPFSSTRTTTSSPSRSFSPALWWRRSKNPLQANSIAASLSWCSRDWPQLLWISPITNSLSPLELYESTPQITIYLEVRLIDWIDLFNLQIERFLSKREGEKGRRFGGNWEWRGRDLVQIAK